MIKHRESYLKTAVSMAVLATMGAAAIAYLFFDLRRSLNGGVAYSILLSAIILLLLCFEFGVVLVLTGSLVVLRRDRLEALGFPYAGGPREWHGGALVRLLRGVLRKVRALGVIRPGQLDLRAGETVVIRSREEILATLDGRGELESLPFMPEMESLCGREARVHRRVDKIFDWITSSGLRRMRDTVILDGLRCDGGFHDACQADCPILWKEAWLRRASDVAEAQFRAPADTSAGLDLRQFTTRIDEESGETRFVCQLCRLPQATTPTPWSSPRNLLRELFSGNVRIAPFIAFIAIFAFNAVQRRVKGACFPLLGHSNLQKTPHGVLNIQPGELVRIKTKHEIEQTLNSQFKNRGLWFDKEMTRFCGGTYKVRARVDRQIDERTGKMVIINTPCITLEGVTATGEYFEFAPLDERIYWREIWLERIEGAKVPASEPPDLSRVEAKVQ